MAHEFIARKGLIVPSGSLLVNTGSVNVGGAVTASFFKGDGSNLTNLPSTNIASAIVITNTFTGDGTTNTFNLGSQYIANSLMVSVDGLFYTPSADFTVSNSDIVFTSAPPSASDITVRAMVNIVSGGVGTYSGSFIGTASFATTALTASYVSGAASDWNTLANKPAGIVSSSTQVDYLQIQNVSSGIVSSSTQVIALLPTGTVSSSAQINTGSFNGSFTGSVLGTSSWSENAVTASYVEYTNIGNKPTLVSASSQIDVTQTTNYSTLATTGSNTFTGVQTISNTTDSTNYLDGALVVAGGVGITKNVNISGSLTVTGLLTAVSMSTQYVTSSQYVVGTSRVILNDDDLVRFAGLSIVDSGSSSPTTASILWDSLQHRFIYENLSGSGYNSAIIIAGPKNTGSLGNEQELTIGRIPYATGGDHIDNSPARVEGTTVHFDANVYATGSVTAAAFTGSLFGTSSWSNNATTASYAANAKLLDGKDVGTFATTGSNNFVGTQTLSGSINFQSGSSISPNLHDLEIKPGVTGQLLLFNSDSSHYLSINTTGITITDLDVLNGVTGSLHGTSSWAQNAISSSYAATASYALNAGAGAGFPFSGSAVITGSLLVSQSGVIVTGSVDVSGGITGSFSGSGAGLYDLRSSLALDTYNFIGDGVTINYVLSQSYTPNSLLVSVEGINYTYIQDFTLSSNTLSFVVAPPSESNVSIRALLAVSSGSYINYTGSFIGDGYGLDNLRGSLAIDEYLFVGDGLTTSYVLSSSYAPPSLNVTVGGLRYISPNDYTVTGSTINFTQAPASESLIVFDGFVVVSSGSVGTFSGSFLGNATTATSASFATTASFASNVLKTKAGSISSASFGGTPYTASVTFGTAFGNTNYSIAVTGEDARIFTVESKTASGFVVNTNSNTAVTGTTYWTCTAFGEN